MHALKHIHVSSSTIYSIGYSRESRLLQVTFRDQNGKPASSYEYLHVLPEMVTDLLFADSVGRHFAKKIKGNPDIPCRKLAEIVTEARVPLSMVVL